MSAYDQPRGASSRSYDFSKSLINEGHEVTFFTNSFCHFTSSEKLEKNEISRLEKIEGINVVWLKTPHYQGNGLGRAINMLVNFWRILTESKKIELKTPDLIIGPSVPLFTGLAGYLVAKRFNKPFVFEIRDVWPEALALMGAISRYGITYIVFRWIEIYLYKKSRLIISTLPIVEEHVEDSIGEPKEIEYIPNGVDFDFYGPQCSVLKVNKEIYHVKYIGGFGVDHDINLILEVAKNLHVRNDNRFKFHLIGRGIKKRESQNFIKKHNLGNIDIYDSILKSDIPKEQCSADILIAAVTDSESFRFGLNLNKLCGYLASGRPVILAGNPPNDPISESQAWFTVRAGDVGGVIEALNKIKSMSETELIERGSIGRRYAYKTLSMDNLGPKMVNVLKRVVEEIPKN